MKQFNPKLFILLLSLCLGSVQAYTQSMLQKADIIGKNKVVELNQLHYNLSKNHQENYAKALQLAKTKGWPVQKETADGKLIVLYGLDQFNQPVYVTSNNLNSAQTTSTNTIQPGGSTGLDLTGKGLTIGLWEVGQPRLTHIETYGRLIQQDSSGAPGLSNHANHVAGTLIATGLLPQAKGMANEATVAAYTADNDLAEMAAAAADGLILSNHSYGFISGWYYNYFGDGLWAWFGATEISETEDYSFGNYTQVSQSIDQIAYNAPTYLVVKSAGNDRLEGPAPGAEHWYFNPTGGETGAGAWEKSVAVRDFDGGDHGYDCIGTQSAAKNILTVGAVEDIVTGYGNRTDVVMSAFSAWGPTDDGRIKPEIVANGVSLISSIAASDSAYASSSGTSMAAPSVTGTLTLLQEHYHNLYGSFMSAATLKGLAIHTADEAGNNPGPDYRFGFGLLNAEKAAKVISEKDVQTYIKEEVLENGETYTFEFEYDGLKPLVSTISWTDAPAIVGAEWPVLDDTTIRLVNDLDIRIAHNGTAYQPWTLDPANPSGAAVVGDNFRDNVEKINIANAPAGTYTVTVTHKGTLEGGAQPFTLIISDENLPERAIIALSPEAIRQLLTVGDSTSQSLVIENQGNVPLHYSLGIRSPQQAAAPKVAALLKTSSLKTENEQASVSSGPYTISRRLAQVSMKRMALARSPIHPLAQHDTTSLVLTHSLSQEILAGNSIQCGSGEEGMRVHADNSYWRAFDLEAFGLTGNFEVDTVQFGVESATSGSGEGQPVNIRLYTTNGEFPGGHLTLIGATEYLLPDQSLSVVSVPLQATAFSGTTLVVEIHTPDGTQGLNNFFIGSNNAGENGPSYQSFPGCGFADPTPLTAIGYTGIHFVMNVIGSESSEWLTISSQTDPVAAGSSAALNLDFNAGALTPGEYQAELVIANSDYEQPEVVVPVLLTVKAQGPPALTITGFYLIDADEDAVLTEIKDGDVIDLSELPTDKLNFMVTTEPAHVSKVVFSFRGARMPGSLRDYFAPYSLFGDWWGNYFGFTPQPRHYALTAVPYIGRREGDAKSIDFEIIRGAEDNRPIVFPNPFNHHLNIKFPDRYVDFVSVSLIDRYGRSRFLGFRMIGYGDKVLRFDLRRLRLRSGHDYYLKIESWKHKTAIIRVVKK